MVVLASAQPASLRLTLALAGAILFATAATTRWQRPIPAASVAVLIVIVAGWLFGATLVWGTGYATKVRWAAAWTSNGQAWQWTALLAVALLGIVATGLALRSFAHQQRRRGWMLAAISGAAFAGWSAVVRYPVGFAIIAAVAGFAALLFVAAPPPVDTATGQPEGGGVRHRAAVPVLVAAIAIGVGWVIYAFAWLVVGPEGGFTNCHCWADSYNDWQYQTQFAVAIAGAVSGVVTAVLYLLGRRVGSMLGGVVAVAAVCGWLAFLAAA